ncbi:von Willebrand factor-like [Onthophagus taurus]|uniref:von Willebrand factor-like n=1 Tax=Onthophagus taurus TaxID=166361 RepID=UPI0039BEA072
MYPIFAIFLVCGVAVFGEECGLNQVWDDCGSNCVDYCNKEVDPNEVCTLECVPGCYCASGFIKKAVDSDECVTEENCPAPCGHNKIYRECGSMCPKYCGQPDDIFCPAVCVSGCFCKDGYILADENSTHCIPEHHCHV